MAKEITVRLRNEASDVIGAYAAAHRVSNGDATRQAIGLLRFVDASLADGWTFYAVKKRRWGRSKAMRVRFDMEGR